MSKENTSKDWLETEYKKMIANKKQKLIRIIEPHNNKARPVKQKWFLSRDFKKIKKFAFGMVMLAFNAEKEKMFGNVYAISHSEVNKKPLSFFVLNCYNDKLKAHHMDFFNKYGFIIMNPRLVSGQHSGTKQQVEEGCVSFPGRATTIVGRYYKAIVEFEYLTFKKNSEEVDGIATGTEDLKGFLAQLFQHEIDHLNGINIYDA